MLEGDATNLSLSEGELLQNSKELNVMLFGEDNSNDDEYGRSDTMIMMTIDNNHKKLKLTSFQRDTYVYIPGYGMTSSTHLITTAEQSFQFRQLRQTSASRLTVMRLLTLTALRRLSTPSAVLIWNYSGRN